MATPFDKTETAAKPQAPAVVAPEAPKMVKTAPNLVAINWYGQRAEVGKNPTQIWPAWQDGVEDAPYPCGFTFDQGIVVDVYGKIQKLNPLQYASDATAKRLLAKFRELLPEVITEITELHFHPASPVQPSINQRVLQIPGLDPWLAGELACKIMFNGWQYFVTWLKYTLEPQGIKVNDQVTAEGL